MSWRWLLFDYADPELPLSFWQRIRISTRNLPVWKLPKPARFGRYLYIFSMMFFGGALLLWVRWIPPHWLLPVAPCAYWVWGTCTYGVCCRKEHFLRLRLEGFNCCTSCGYWLRGLDSETATCPECGERIIDLND